MVKVLLIFLYYFNTPQYQQCIFCNQFSAEREIYTVQWAPQNNTRIVETNVNGFDQLITQGRSLDGVHHGQSLPGFSQNTWRCTTLGAAFGRWNMETQSLCSYGLPRSQHSTPLPPGAKMRRPRRRWSASWWQVQLRKRVVCSRQEYLPLRCAAIVWTLVVCSATAIV